MNILGLFFALDVAREEKTILTLITILSPLFLSRCEILEDSFGILRKF